MALINIFFWTVLVLTAISFGVLLHQYDKDRRQALAELQRLQYCELRIRQTAHKKYNMQKPTADYNIRDSKYNQIRTRPVAQIHVQKSRTFMKSRSTTHCYRKINVSDPVSREMYLEYAI